MISYISGLWFVLLGMAMFGLTAAIIHWREELVVVMAILLRIGQDEEE